ncbi:hypothetical protein F8388_007833, partial [Cannabis sativa]
IKKHYPFLVLVEWIMGALGLSWRLPNSQLFHNPLRLRPLPFCTKSSKLQSLPLRRNIESFSLRPCLALSNSTQFQKEEETEEEEEEEESGSNDSGGSGNSNIIIYSCLVGLLTGIGIVLFNKGVHEIRDLFWDGQPHRGASWVREEPIQDIWKRVVLVPASGGLIVGVLNEIRNALVDDGDGLPSSVWNGVKAVSRPFLKAVAACVTLGTGNSLGPEGPSVEIGTSIAKGVGNVFDKSSNKKLSLVAAGSAAGIASGFNAAVAGCFFAVESVLWPSPTNPSSLTLTNTTSMVILSAVIASVVSEVGLGSEPAFTVPEFDFRSPTELPLYLLLGVLCGLIFTTSLCRASGLVGGYYAPSLFIGAATGMAYGKIVSSVVNQPNPVGMAATLAGVCQVPLTAVLLLFELTQDYRIVLPLLGTVGLSSWVTSRQSRRRDVQGKRKPKPKQEQSPNMLPFSASGLPSNYALMRKEDTTSDLCEIESSLCIEDSDTETENLEAKICVSEAMRTRYVTVMMNTLLTEALTLMLMEKQPCAMIVDNDNILIGLLTLKDIQDFSKYAKTRSRISKEVLVSEMCSLDGGNCRVPWAATPSMDLLYVQMIMNKRGIDEVPVVTEQFEDHRGHLVGLLDRECISLTQRALATREYLC